MPRRRKLAGLECLVDLARKAEILEREMSAQRRAIEQLTGKAPRAVNRPLPHVPAPCPEPAR